MKVSGFYVTKNGKIVDEKDAMKVSVGVAKTVLMTTCTHQAVGLIQTQLPLGLIAHASDLNTTTAVVNGTQQVSSVSVAFDPLIHTLQDVAEPFSMGFAMKGIFMKMQGKESEGNKVMKNSIYGYLTVQFLPKIYDLLRTIDF